MKKKRRPKPDATSDHEFSIQRADLWSVDLRTSREVLEQIELTQRIARGQPELSSQLTPIAHMLLARLTETNKDYARRISVSQPSDRSGSHWIDRFPGSIDTAMCAEQFRTKIQAFLAALNKTDANVRISSTYRPPERAYLMHWAWQIAHNVISPVHVPSMDGVNILWTHLNNRGKPDLPKSRSAASQMVTGFELVRRPALVSRHTEGHAIDMTISWTGDLDIQLPDDSIETIRSTPRTGMNSDLIRCGAEYGVIKAVFSNDPPHWSNDGH